MDQKTEHRPRRPDFAASYEGTCSVCDDEILVGDRCTYEDDELVHYDCAGEDAD